MRGARLDRRFVCTAAFAAFLAACAAHGGGFIPTPQAPAGAYGAPAIPLVVARDLGRSDPRKIVGGAIVLRYNHEAELEELVDRLGDPYSPQFRQFLTPQQFDARYGLTAQQRQRVLDALRRAGFTVQAGSVSGSVIDVSAPVAAAERFFQTRIDDVAQERYGTRYANVRPVRVPAPIAPLVRGVELNSIVFARAALAAASDDDPDASSVNAIQNGGFERRLTHWGACDKVRISQRHPYAGKYDALLGSPTTTAGAIDGSETLCQRVTIPEKAVLSVHTWSVTNLTKLTQGFQAIGLMTQPGGKIVTVLRKNLVDRSHWVHNSYDLSAYAGRDLYLYFRIYGRGQKNLYNTMFVDDVALTGVAPTPTPSTSPTPVGPGPGTPLTGPTFGPNGAWAPRGVADGLDLPVQHGYDGRGSSTAVIIPSAVRTSDLSAFLSANGITRTGTLSQKKIDGGPGSDPHEGMIEVETIAALAPGTHIIAYEVPELTNAHILNAYQAALNDRPAVIDSSFGQCESQDTAFDDAVEQDAIAGAATGMTFLAASGDLGSACFNNSTNVTLKGPEVPASAPHVLAIGGNDSATPGPVANPAVWSGNNGQFVGASGGGVSQHWKIPAYQKGLTGSPASATQRNVPDLSLPAVDDDLLIYGGDEVWGGTSWSSSVAAALFAQTVEICGRLGQANPAVYAVFGKHGEGKLFVDVIHGRNKYASFNGYAATTGYDDASGIGIPKGFDFATALCGKSPATLRFP